MTLPYRIGIIAALFVATFMSGFFYGRSSETSKQDRAANIAYQNSEEAQYEVNQLDDYNQCLRISRVPDECKVLMRGLEKAPKSK